MSRVSLSRIASPDEGPIDIQLGTNLHSPGMVVQTIHTRTDALTQYSSLATVNGTTITDLNLTITPRFSNSLLVMQWMINCEMSPFATNKVFLIHKNGSLITTLGYEAYNVNGGNNRWSGVLAGKYDVDSDSTLENYIIQYAIPAFGATEQTFAPAIRAANSSAGTLFLNRTVNAATPADGYELAVSSGVIMEVAQ
jgi:hypothetical protein